MYWYNRVLVDHEEQMYKDFDIFLVNFRVDLVYALFAVAEKSMPCLRT